MDTPWGRRVSHTVSGVTVILTLFSDARVFHLMEVLLYQACENGLTLGQALQVTCSVVQIFLSNCCQNCATKT